MNLASCHPNRKHKAKGLCGACYDRELRQANETYRKSQRDNTSKWLNNLTDAQRNRLNKIRRDRWDKVRDDPEHKLKRRNARLLKKYGIDDAMYQNILARQGGGCAICFRKPSHTPLHVDHDHTSGFVRGILCHQCNWYLGTIESDRSLIDRIIKYLSNGGIDGIQRDKS